MEKFEGFDKNIIEKTEKEIAWEQKREEIEKITDNLDERIDEGIKETVVALNMNGILTNESCEGHVDRGFPYPRVVFAAEGEPTWRYKGQRDLFIRVAEEKGIPLDKMEEATPESDKLYREVKFEADEILYSRDENEIIETEEYKEWKKKNKEMFEKAQDLLKEYNEDTEQNDPDTKIILEGNEETELTFRPHSGFNRRADALLHDKKQEEVDLKLTEEKLKKRRASMKKFTEFLRKKYLS